jgi:hypothetical protein
MVRFNPTSFNPRNHQPEGQGLSIDLHYREEEKQGEAASMRLWGQDSIVAMKVSAGALMN